jgi:hypothetical protein
MSILVETSSLKVNSKVELPKGKFNNKSQTWEFKDSTIVNHKDFTVFMGTSTPTTYSATTRIGADNDSDDRGT